MLRFLIFCLSFFCFIGESGAQRETSDTVFNRDNQLKNDSITIVPNNPLPLTPSALDRDKKRDYKLKPPIDVPLTALSSAFTLYAFGKIYDRDASSIQQIEGLSTSRIPRFDRWATDVFSEKAADVSDLFFYGSIPVPVLMILADGKMRRDAAKLAFLYLEAMAVTGVLYSGSAYLTGRYRPYTYNPEAPMELRTRGNAKNSFFAGHVALVGTSTFFMAKVFSDYHPDSKLKWIPYTVASAATIATGYLRHRGGRHFPSDILVGAAVGSLSGILIPQFHKNKKLQKSGLTITPFTGKSHGVFVVYNVERKRSFL